MKVLFEIYLEIQSDPNQLGITWKSGSVVSAVKSENVDSNNLICSEFIKSEFDG